MYHLTQAIAGWLIIMGMVLGGVGGLFIILTAVRALATITRPVRVSSPKAQENETVDIYRGASDNPAF